jgi:WhiB family transcriptional regulator, redox-sensing transcriptional regulator
LPKRGFRERVNSRKTTPQTLVKAYAQGILEWLKIRKTAVKKPDRFSIYNRRKCPMDMQWLNEARCLTEDPELFFPVGNTGPAAEQIEQAKAVCRECKVSASCLEYAIKENQDSGVWGGLSEDERKSLKRKYARARRAG